MTCTLEWIAGSVALARLHHAAAARLGDPYVWWTAVKAHSVTLAEIKGADRPLPPGGAKALCDALRAAGFARRTHARRVGDSVRMVEKAL